MRYLPFFIKVFLLGMLLQFLLQTFVTYKLGIDFPHIRAWKEVALVLFLLFFFFFSRKQRKKAKVQNASGESFFAYVGSLLRKDRLIGFLQVVFALSIVVCFFISFLYHQQPLSAFLLACKYDFLGFFIFFLFAHIGGLLSQAARAQILYRYVRVAKRCLGLALVWRVMIWIKPGIGEVLFGYSRDAIEGEIGSPPPVAYWTNLYQRDGYMRNQFIFERPISWGFWLVAFWPLFYFFVLARKSLRTTWLWRLLYGVNVWLTFSRAAWISWIVLTCILFFLTYRIHRKKAFMIMGILFVTIGGAGIYLGESIREREFSTTGHAESIVEGWRRFVSSPFFGQGAATAGPGSAQIAFKTGNPGFKFNPENQYLQILDEFGILGGIGWFVLFFGLVFAGSKYFLKLLLTQKVQKREDKTIGKISRENAFPTKGAGKFFATCFSSFSSSFFVAFSLGMLGLAISGLFLHSFVDRMIVYPLMTLYGLRRSTKEENMQ